MSRLSQGQLFPGPPETSRAIVPVTSASPKKFVMTRSFPVGTTNVALATHWFRFSRGPALHRDLGRLPSGSLGPEQAPGYWPC